ncbi:hypothetical protein L1987_48530 [Smallanthus sonchifolius]|uniref:Uncharacterized protein n=1 Tax=Smallanthus sonchifolius TaxID=185202 RepID=A0ACB9FS69_9ASTR|nr:hypothetical protein L1987_48530 [Smallanthus sonchifolius]
MAYHSQTDGGSWDSHLPLAEFSYKNSYHTTIGVPPNEMLYGRRCRTPVCWGEIGQKELGSLEIDLPDELSGILPTFHVPHLRKCLADESAHVQLNDIEVDNSLNYVEEPVAILDRKEKPL